MKDWKRTTISEEKTVLEAISMIDSTDARIALVVTDSFQLIGTITDGDIRRAILKGVKLDGQLSCVINRDPICSLVENSESDCDKLLKKYKINQIPIVDEEKVVKGLYLADELKQTMPKTNPVVLMVGGLGSRLGDLTANCPKPMLKIGGKPILETIVSNFKSEGFDQFYFAVNFKSEVIESHFRDGEGHDVNITYLKEKKRMGTAGSLSSLKGKVDQPLIVMNGDLLTSISFNELIKFHSETGAVATMCVRDYEIQIPFGVVETKGTSIVRVSEKPVKRYFVNAGIYIIEPSVLERIPDDQYFDMPGLFNELLESGQKTSVFPIREYWLDVGRKEDFKKANMEFGKNFS